MIIKVERSGGITGQIISNQLDTEKLSPSLVSILKGIIDNGKLSSLPLKKAPLGAADHYIYKITIQDGSKKRIIECNQYNISDDLKSLVNRVENNSSKKK